MSLPKIKKAAVVTALGTRLAIRDVPVPDVGPGQVLMRVRASGVCHTDLHAANGDWPVKPPPPFIPGHEGVGEVAAVGAGVTDLKEGDRIGARWLHTACGRCPHCIRGWETLCESQQRTGYTGRWRLCRVRQGGCEPRRAGARQNGVRPRSTDPVRRGETLYKGLRETETKPSQWVAISGIGGLWQMAVQYAKAMGLKVAAVEIAEDKLALAKSLRADIRVFSGSS